MPNDLQPTLPSNDPLPPSPAAPKPTLTGWRKGLVIAGVIAFALRILLAVFSFSSHHVTKTSTIATAGELPSWPLKAGDVFTLKPGDPAIAKWAESPDNDGFLVQAVELNGKPVTDTKVCALEPDYMAAADAPGGTLTLVSQDGTGDWRVHWQGGDTLPVEPLDPKQSASDTQDQRNANCGKDALFMMSQAQLHSWLNMQAGIVAAKPTGNDTLDTQPVPPSK
jgi:hypothetical protein